MLTLCDRLIRLQTSLYMQTAAIQCVWFPIFFVVFICSLADTVFGGSLSSSLSYNHMPSKAMYWEVIRQVGNFSLKCGRGSGVPIGEFHSLALSSNQALFGTFISLSHVPFFRIFYSSLLLFCCLLLPLASPLLFPCTRYPL